MSGAGGLEEGRKRGQRHLRLPGGVLVVSRRVTGGAFRNWFQPRLMSGPFVPSVTLWAERS